MGSSAATCTSQLARHQRPSPQHTPNGFATAKRHHLAAANRERGYMHRAPRRRNHWVSAVIACRARHAARASRRCGVCHAADRGAVSEPQVLSTGALLDQHELPTPSIRGSQSYAEMILSGDIGHRPALAGWPAVTNRGSSVKSKLAAAAIIAALFVTAVPAQAFAAVRIVKVQYDSPGTDSGSNKSLNAEWVKIRNSGSKAKQLKGWTLRDTSGHVYRFGSYRLGAGKAVTIHTGPTPDAGPTPPHIATGMRVRTCGITQATRRS